jgi:magnesium transporter
MGTDSTILVRWHCVLFNLDPIRAIIMSDRVILIVPDGADSLLSIIEDHILQWAERFHRARPVRGQAEAQVHPATSNSNKGAGGAGTSAIASSSAGTASAGPSSSSAGIADSSAMGASGTNPRSNSILNSPSERFTDLALQGDDAVESVSSASTSVSLQGSAYVEQAPVLHSGGPIGTGPAELGVSFDQQEDVDYVPFEMHAYETLLTTVASLQAQEYARTNGEVQSILMQFKQKGCILPIEAQEKMRNLKNYMSQMTSRLSAYQRTLEGIVDDEESMALMNLTLLHTQPRLYKFPLSNDLLSTHEEVQELLENHLSDYSTGEIKLEYLKVQMQSAEELVSLRLDTARNQLMVANTTLQVLSIAIGIGAFVTGIFGMNLDNVYTLQEVSGLFHEVWAVTIFVIIVGFFTSIWYLRYTGVLPLELKPLTMVWDKAMGK